MTDEEIRSIVKEVVAELGRHPACEFCGTDERVKAHRNEHEFIQSLMKVSERWDNVRWDLLRDVLKWGSRILITAMILGMVIMAVKAGGGVRLQ